MIPHNKKVSDEDLVSAYATTGNIWKVGEKVGLWGQTVWARLRKLGVPMKRRWTEAEIGELRQLYTQAEYGGPVALTNLAEHMGRMRSNVCRKARELGLPTNYNRKETEESRAKMLAVSKMRWTIHPHPKGAYKGGGVIKVCPQCGRFFELSKSEAVLRLHCSRQCYALSKKDRMFTRTKGGRREDIGIFVRSSWEANYARYLNMLKANGDILQWEYEAEAFEFKRIKKGTRSYRPDFKIWFPDGHIEYHEVKGWLMPKAKTALKRMAKYYPEVKLIIIDKDWFAAAKRQGLPALIEGWE